MSARNDPEARVATWSRRCALAVLGALFAFVLLMAIAMQLYPGGNWLDPAASGHRFFYNFFCDLTQPVSLSGVDNRLGAGFARVGMWCFALALGGFFWLVPLHFASTVSARVGLWVRRLGECAVLGVALVPLLPSQKFGHFHGLLTLSASALGILAALAAVIALCRSEPRARWLGGLGALALALGAFDALLFAYHLKDSAPPPLLLPAAQKVTALLLSAWMIGVAWYLLKPTQRGVSHRP